MKSVQGSQMLVQWCSVIVSSTCLVPTVMYCKGPVELTNISLNRTSLEYGGQGWKTVEFFSAVVFFSIQFALVVISDDIILMLVMYNSCC